MDTVLFLLGAYGYVDVFLVVLARMLGFFIILPVVSGQNIPMSARVALSVYMSYILIMSQQVSITYNDTIPGFVLLIIIEFAVGFVLGFVVYMVFAIIYFTGQLIDYQIGFSMVSVFDALSDIQVPITGNMIYFIVCAFVVASGGLNSLIASIFNSYILLPVGIAEIVGNTTLLSYLQELAISYIVLGVKIAMPVMGPILVLDVALGLLVKAVPQMNVFVVGLPLKLLVGMSILFAVTANYYNIFDIIWTESMKAISNALRGMLP